MDPASTQRAVEGRTDAMNICPQSYNDPQEMLISQDMLRRKCFCLRPMPCCCLFGPLVPRWAWCSAFLLVGYVTVSTIIFFAMHFIQYPGNWEGDFPVNGSSPSDFIAARSDNMLMKAMRLPVPLQPDSKQAPVVFFGGNAQGMSGAAVDAAWLLGALYNEEHTFQFQVHTTSYRGYSPNRGWVSQDGLTKDAEDLLDHALNSTHGSLKGRIILGGWSMGAGVACQLAAARPENIAGVVLFSPWSTMRTETLNIAAPLSYLLWPWIWMSYPWDSVAAVASLPADIPVAVISAGADKVIKPFEHRRVYDASTARNKWWLPVANANHPDLPGEVATYSEKLAEWMKLSWDRVQVFGPSKYHDTSGKYMLDPRKRAFDVFGDFAISVQKLFNIKRADPSIAKPVLVV